MMNLRSETRNSWYGAIRLTMITSLMLLICLIPICSFASASVTTELSIDESMPVVISEAGTYQLFSFIADEDGRYYFEISQNSSSEKIQLKLYDAQLIELACYSKMYNTDKLFYDLEGNNLYYLRAEYQNASASGVFMVTAKKNIPVTSISLSIEDGLEIYQGESAGFTWTVEPKNASNKELRFEYSSIATFINNYDRVAQAGHFYGAHTGQCTVTVSSDDNPSASVTVTITVCPLSEFQPITLTLGDTVQVTTSEMEPFKIISFIPEKDGKYYFETSEISGCGGCLYLYDEQWDNICHDESMNNGDKLVCMLEGNKRYYLKAKTNYTGNDYGSF